MVIGIPKEIKDHEGRIALTPEKVKILHNEGHEILVEQSAGYLSGFLDEDYSQSGAKITCATQVWHKSKLVLKVKEPLESEYDYLRKGLKLFTFFHFAGNPKLQKACKDSKVKAIPYESVVAPGGCRPILKAMGLIAGEIATDVGAHYLRQENRGSGILLRDATVTILGSAGTVGGRALELLQKRVMTLYAIDSRYTVNSKYRNVTLLTSNPENIKTALLKSNLVIGAATNKNLGAPKLITREVIEKMPQLSVLVDVAIDEGGVSETSIPTSHSKPTYIDGNVIHFCVPNMPGTAPQSSTLALSNASFKYVLMLVNGKNIPLLTTE